MRVTMMSLSPKRTRVRTMLWLVFSIALLSCMVGIPFTRSVVYASSMDAPQSSTNDSNPLYGDVNGDGAITIMDVFMVAVAFGSYPGHPEWNSGADLNNDDVVNTIDLWLVMDAVVGRLWSDDSYWYMKIKANPTIHPNSAQMIAWLKGEGSNYNGLNAYINWKHYTAPTFDASEDSRRVTVYDEDGNAGTHWWYNVPIPNDLVPVTDDTDRSMVIIDWPNRECYQFWRFDYYADYIDGQYAEYKAGAGWKWDLDRSGVAPNGQWTVGGSSVPRLAVDIRDEDIATGVINHPLGCCLTHVKQSVHVYPPASVSDGTGTATYAIPMGARIQLDPSVDINAYGLNPTAKIIAKALQDYGVVVKESGGGWFLYAEHDLSAHWDSNMANGILAALPDDKWRVIDYTQGAEVNLE